MVDIVDKEIKIEDNEEKVVKKEKESKEKVKEEIKEEVVKEIVLVKLENDDEKLEKL